MYSDSGQHNKAHLLVRIKKHYASLAGREMSSETFAKLKMMNFENALNLLVKLTQAEEESQPTEAIDGIVNEAVISQ